MRKGVQKFQCGDEGSRVSRKRVLSPVATIVAIEDWDIDLNARDRTCGYSSDSESEPKSSSTSSSSSTPGVSLNLLRINERRIRSASGTIAPPVANFCDPVSDCRNCKKS